MKRLTCEMCGSIDLVKQDGMFVCQSCGTKYSLEEARKMMIEGTVTIDTSKEEQNLIQVLETSIKTKNYGELYSTASKLVEKNPKLWQGYYYKALGAGYSTHGNDNKFPESIIYFDKALELSNGEEEAKLTITKGAMDLINDLMDLYHSLLREVSLDKVLANSYIAYATSSYKFLEHIRDDYKTPCELVFNTQNAIFDKVYNSVVDAKGFSDAMYGRDREDRTDEKYARWLTENDGIIAITSSLLNDLPILPDKVDQTLRFFQKVIRSVTHSCSYRLVNGEYEESRSPSRADVKEKNNLWESTNDKAKVFVARGQERIKKYKADRIEEYWDAHKEEKEEMLANKSDLEEQLKPYDDAIAELDNAIKEQKALLKKSPDAEPGMDELQKNISDVQAQIKKCGLFDFKAKKPLKEQLGKYESELDKLKAVATGKMNDFNKDINSKISDLNGQRQAQVDGRSSVDAQIKKILNELTKER